MEEWKSIANFLLKEDKEVFRKSCQSINGELYNELTQISKELTERHKDSIWSAHEEEKKDKEVYIIRLDK